MNASAAENPNPDLDMPDLCRPIAEASPVPMAGVEGSSHIVRYVNPALCVLVGKRQEELIGNRFSGVVPAGEELLSLVDRVYRTGQAETHIGQEHSSDHPFYWSYVMWPVLAAGGRPVGIMIQVTETTPFHRQAASMNQALMIGSVRQHELTETAEKLNAQLLRANSDLKQFAFAASHDLQEPLRTLTSYSQLLLKRYRGQLEDDASLYVDFIRTAATRMQELLAALLAYTRSGEEAAEPAECIDLNPIVQRVTESLKAAIDESGAVIACGHLPAVRGHTARFVQLFQNLIGNAIKYRGERPLRIHISAEEIHGEWRFAIADNGMGIEPEYHQQIFGVFERLHGKEIPGTGIGLAISQRVVERYGGHIWVESQVGEGATFYFTLPIVT